MRADRLGVTSGCLRLDCDKAKMDCCTGLMRGSCTLHVGVCNSCPSLLVCSHHCRCSSTLPICAREQSFTARLGSEKWPSEVL